MKAFSLLELLLVLALISLMIGMLVPVLNSSTLKEQRTLSRMMETIELGRVQALQFSTSVEIRFQNQQMGLFRDGVLVSRWIPAGDLVNLEKIEFNPSGTVTFPPPGKPILLLVHFQDQIAGIEIQRYTGRASLAFFH